jgi:hypothetical protein
MRGPAHEQHRRFVAAHDRNDHGSLEHRPARFWR